MISRLKNDDGSFDFLAILDTIFGLVREFVVFLGL